MSPILLSTETEAEPNEFACRLATALPDIEQAAMLSTVNRWSRLWSKLASRPRQSRPIWTRACTRPA
jgi:hypothetical protein